MTDTVVHLYYWPTAAPGGRWTLRHEYTTLHTDYGTEREARDAAARLGWRVADDDGLERGR